MKRKHKARKKKLAGFTVVEVMIVLAIAGMILLIVFLAVPAMQRQERNRRRNNDATIILALIFEQKSLTGRFPPSCNNTTASCFLRSQNLGYYDNKTLSLNNVSFENRTTPYTGGDIIDVNDTISTERVSIKSYAKCGENGQITGVGATRNDLATQFALEKFNGSFVACRQL